MYRLFNKLVWTNTARFILFDLNSKLNKICIPIYLNVLISHLGICASRAFVVFFFFFFFFARVSLCPFSHPLGVGICRVLYLISGLDILDILCNIHRSQHFVCSNSFVVYRLYA